MDEHIFAAEVDQDALAWSISSMLAWEGSFPALRSTYSAVYAREYQGL
jgi:hypothetical protein